MQTPATRETAPVAAALMVRLDAGFNFALAVVSSGWIFAIMVLVCLDVGMRNLLNAPISGVAEFIALSVPACVFLQLPSAVAR